MTEYFAGRMLRTAISFTLHGVRDLRNPELSPFFTGPTIPSNQVADGLLAAQTLHQDIGIPPIPAGTYALQAGPPTQQFFIEFLEAAGIEELGTDDISVESADEVIPDLGFRTSFIRDQGRTRAISVPAARSLIRSRTAASSAPVQHIAHPDPIVVADSDPFVAPKIRSMRQYIARYLTPQ